MDFRAKPWYAVRVRSHHERIASTVIESKGFECFLPLYKARRRWSDRIKELDLPLFPGYVFCSFEPAQHGLVVSSPGVASVVKFGLELAPVAPDELESVELLIKSRLDLMPWPRIECGERVCIEEGPLKGLEGVVVRHRSDLRLVVSVMLLQRSVSVEVDHRWLRPERYSPLMWPALAIPRDIRCTP